jgi:membrane-bound lytic murein transglycosylase B
VSLGGLVALVSVSLAAAAGPQLVETGANTAATATAGVVSAPAALVAVADDAGRVTGVSPDVLLAISEVECNFGRCRMGLSDDMVPADVRGHVDGEALKAGGATAALLGLPEGRRVGDWVNPLPVAGGQHAMGFMQFLPSTWRQEARAAPGRPQDPYRPRDSMVVAGSYLARLQAGAVDSRHHSLRGALAVYGGSVSYADRVLAIARGG